MPAPQTLDDLDDLVAGLVAQAGPAQAYRPPRTGERDTVLGVLDRLVAGDPSPAVATALGGLGLDTGLHTDRATGRRYAVAAARPGSERSWGAVVADLGAPPTVLVGVPHIRSDLRTEDIGLALFRAVPGAVLLLAGAHRRAAGGAGDVAHRRDSLFHAVATHLARRGLAQQQLHGYHDDSLPGHDAVVSAGAGRAGELAERVAQRLAEDAGLDVCRAWSRDCGSLQGRTNAQGRAAATAGLPFVHVELNRTTRDDAGARARVAGALAAAVSAVGGRR